MRGAALFLSAALILAPTATATTEFEISFSIPASALNKAHQRTQDFIAFIQSPPSEAQPFETDPMPPPELVEEMVQQMEMLEAIEDMQENDMLMEDLAQDPEPATPLVEPPAFPSALAARPDFVGGDRLEGFELKDVAVGHPGPADLQVADPDEPTCFATLKAAYDACGQDRCAAPGDFEPDSEDEYDRHGDIVTSSACTLAFEAAVARLDECGTTRVCPKMLAKMDTLPTMGPHPLRGPAPGLRGPPGGAPPPPPHGPPHRPAPTFASALGHLEDENLCACGGRVGPARFARLFVSGCAGLPGVPPAFILVAVAIGLFLWALVYLRVVACLHARYARRTGAAPTLGRRVCHRLMAVPLTWFLVNVVTMAAFCVGPLGLLVWIVLAFHIRRRRIAREQAAALRERVLGGQGGKGEVVVVGQVVAPATVDQSVVVQGTVVA